MNRDPLPDVRKSRQQDPQVGVVIISGGCCIAGMAPLDERAGQVVEQAVAETGVSAEVRVLPATAALSGAAPRQVIAELIGEFNTSGRIGLPAVLVNGEVVAKGVIRLEEVRSGLLRAARQRGKESGDAQRS